MNQPLMNQPLMNQPLMNQPLMNQLLMNQPLMEQLLMEQLLMEQLLMNQPLMEQLLMEQLLMERLLKALLVTTYIDMVISINDQLLTRLHRYVFTLTTYPTSGVSTSSFHDYIYPSFNYLFSDSTLSIWSV